MRRLLPVLIAQVSTLLIGLISIRVLSSLVPPEVNGLYGLFLSFAQVGTLLTHAGVINHSSRFWQREHNSAPAYWKFLWLTSWKKGATLLGLTLCLTLGHAILKKDYSFVSAWPALFFGALSLALIEIAALGINALEKHWTVLQVRLAASLLRTFVPLIAVKLLPATFGVLAFAFGLQGILAIGVAALLFGAFGKSLVTPEQQVVWTTELKEYGRPFLLLGIGGWFLTFADRWCLSFFHAEGTVGQFVLATSLAAVPATFVLSFLMQWVFPKIFRESDNATTVDDWRKIARSCDSTTFLFLGLAIASIGLLHLVAPFLVRMNDDQRFWLIGPKYQPAMGMIFVAGMSMVAAQVCQFHYLLLQGQKKTWAMVRIMAVLAAVKTTGAFIGSYISVEAFNTWLILSPFIVLLVGRQLIRAVGLQPVAAGVPK